MQSDIGEVVVMFTQTAQPEVAVDVWRAVQDREPVGCQWWECRAALMVCLAHSMLVMELRWASLIEAEPVLRASLFD